MLKVNRSSFQINGSYKDSQYAIYIAGTVEVTLGHETKRLQAIMYRGNKPSHLDGIRVYGIVGRYLTGTTSWPASVNLPNDWENPSVSFGFSSHSGKHRKTLISFAR